jgi:hypothetical protein
VTIVSNTSPITNLAAIGHLNLLEQLYGTIIIPQAVFDEMVTVDTPVPGTIEVQTLPWIQTRPLRNCDRLEELLQEIDAGEAEAILLALELSADRLLIDDYQGRAVARRIGIPITGLLGILLISKERGLTQAVKPLLDNLISEAGFRVSDSLYRNVVQSAGESIF